MSHTSAAEDGEAGQPYRLMNLSKTYPPITFHVKWKCVIILALINGRWHNYVYTLQYNWLVQLVKCTKTVFCWKLTSIRHKLHACDMHSVHFTHILTLVCSNLNNCNCHIAVQSTIRPVKSRTVWIKASTTFCRFAYASASLANSLAKNYSVENVWGTGPCFRQWDKKNSWSAPVLRLGVKMSQLDFCYSRGTFLS